MKATTESSRLYFRALTVLIWAALPANALLFALSWSQLPARLATHFDFRNRPNGWMSREGSFAGAVFLATFLAVIATFALSRVKKSDAAAWGLLASFYLIQGTLLWAEHSIIEYNVYGYPINVTPVFSVGIAAAVLLVILALAAGRGAELPPQTLLAEATHSSPAFALILGLPTIVFALLITKIPIPGLKVGLGLGMILMGFAAALAGGGFHYLFTPAGVDIRALGFRLRSVPAGEIKSYAVERWNALGGYGIRGVGERRAYVWGNRGVRIKTAEGEVFLGHDDPDELVHDLDLITNHEGREVSRRA
jgi:Protein of unknown function (DUF1648)